MSIDSIYCCLLRWIIFSQCDAMRCGAVRCGAVEYVDACLLASWLERFRTLDDCLDCGEEIGARCACFRVFRSVEVC